MYHISDLKRFNRCPRYYFLSRDNEIDNVQYLRSDESIIELLAKHLHIEDYFKGSVGDKNDIFFNNANNYEWFLKTRFEIDDFRIKIPIMHKCGNSFDLYFAYHNTQIKELDLYYYRCNLEVLRKLGIEVNEIYVAYINPEYVFDDELNYDELFYITNHYKGRRLIDLFDDEIADYKETIKHIEGTDLNSYVPKKNRYCHFRSICPYYYECFKDEINLPVNSILTLVSSQNKEKMYESGIKYLKDANPELLEGNQIQYAQIMADRLGGLFVDKFNLKKFLNKLQGRPISFIDFEWDTYLVPKYNGMSPLDVLPFEYALYILDENDELKHYTFVGNGDCRRDFVEALLKQIPPSGPIVAYNALGAEVRRIRELASYFPEYRIELENIANRFVDLAMPFIEGIIYDVRIAGNFSLKRLVDVVSDLNYKNLSINDGIEAVKKWREIDLNNGEINEEEVINNLIEYCSLDAYGLYLVYKWLIKQI